MPAHRPPTRRRRQTRDRTPSQFAVGGKKIHQTEEELFLLKLRKKSTEENDDFQTAGFR